MRPHSRPQHYSNFARQSAAGTPFQNWHSRLVSFHALTDNICHGIAELQLVSMPDASNSKCHWFKLPAELRNQIYQLCLVGHHRIHVIVRREEVKASQASYKWTLPIPQEPSILATSKRIRQEALAMYYSNSMLQIAAPYHCTALPGLLSTYTTRLGSERLKLLSSARLMINMFSRGHWIVSCQLSQQGVLSVAINRFCKEGSHGPVQQSNQCSCDLVASASARAPQDRTGQDLLEVLRAFAKWYEPQESQDVCKSCGLKMLKRVVRKEDQDWTYPDRNRIHTVRSSRGRRTSDGATWSNSILSRRYRPSSNQDDLAYKLTCLSTAVL